MRKISVDLELRKAKSLFRKGNLENARQVYQKILEAYPKNRQAQKGLSSLQIISPTLRVQHPPREILHQIQDMFARSKFPSVVKETHKLIEQYPNSAILWELLGIASKELNKIEEATGAFQRVLNLNPDYPDGYNNLGVAFQANGNLKEAVEAYNKALSLNPNYPQAYFNLGNVLRTLGLLEDAVEAFGKAISLKPDYAEAYFNLGNVRQDQDRLEDAVEAFRKTISLMPDYVEVYNNLGNALKDMGKIDDSIDAFGKAISIKPDYAEAHRNLSVIKKYDEGDLQIDTVEKLLSATGITENDLCKIHYTYAKMNEDLGMLDIAFQHYVIGGRLRKKLLAYDLSQDQDLFCQVRKTAQKLKEFTLEPIRNEEKHLPIFILGMPRSGTTLVEQIISCHSDVVAGGELPIVGQLGFGISSGAETISSKKLINLRKAILGNTKRLAKEKKFITDKMPHNFLFVGLILSALPECKIIYVNRSPAAVCWSNFKHYFSGSGLGYSYDLQDVVDYFNLHQELMRFWNELYCDRIYHLDYDMLTSDQEAQTRNLIEFLDLDWQDRCLLPHKNKRIVKTASQQQVQQKVYQGSSQSWRRFQPFLQDAFDGLA